MKSNLIQKSVRLPKEVVDFIEKQPGCNFSSKLLNLVNEFISGDSKRCKSMEISRKELEKLNKELAGYYNLVRSSRNLSIKYEHLLRGLEAEIQSLENGKDEKNES